MKLRQYEYCVVLNQIVSPMINTSRVSNEVLMTVWVVAAWRGWEGREHSQTP